MKKRFTFGKIAFHTSRKINPVAVDVELRRRGGEPTFTVDPQTRERIPTGETTPEYMELSICGYIWNSRGTDCVAGGQCLDEIAKYRRQLSNLGLFNKLYGYWKAYHLNGMHAVTPEQEAAIEGWKKEGWKYCYTEACEKLREAGLYTVPYTGKSSGRLYNNEPYTYGHAWLVQELPEDVLHDIEELLSA